MEVEAELYDWTDKGMKRSSNGHWHCQERGYQAAGGGGRAQETADDARYGCHSGYRGREEAMSRKNIKPQDRLNFDEFFRKICKAGLLCGVETRAGDEIAGAMALFDVDWDRYLREAQDELNAEVNK